MQEPIRENGHRVLLLTLYGEGVEPTTLQIKILSLCIYGVMLPFQENKVHNVVCHFHWCLQAYLFHRYKHRLSSLEELKRLQLN